MIFTDKSQRKNIMEDFNFPFQKQLIIPGRYLNKLYLKPDIWWLN